MKGFCRCTTSKSGTPLKKPRKKRNSPKAEKQKSPKNPLRNYKTFMKSTQIANVQIKKSTIDAYLSLGFRV
jgi:hypothetical protein